MMRFSSITISPERIGLKVGTKRIALMDHDNKVLSREPSNNALLTDAKLPPN